METQNNYSCSQSELYSGARMVVRAAIREISGFTPKKPKYILAFFNAIRAEIAAAEALPDEDFREAAVAALHETLKEKSTLCLNKWQDLKSHIEDATAFQGSLRPIALEAAGANKYEPASHHDWESVSSLMASGKLFISENTSALEADGNMPLDFLTQWDATTLEFTDALEEFQDSEELKLQQTQAKVAANNVIYTKIIQICKDGARIFRHDAAKREQFIWDSILYILRGAGIAGLRGIIRNSVTHLPVSGATVLVVETGDTATADEFGRFRITGVPAGNYTIEVRATGFIGQHLPFEILTGTISTLDIDLAPQP